MAAADISKLEEHLATRSYVEGSVFLSSSPITRGRKLRDTLSITLNSIIFVLNEALTTH